MNITTKNLSDTKLELVIGVDQEILDASKTVVLKQLARKVKIQGFREGKAPLNLVEKHVDPAVLANQFLDETVNRAFIQAIVDEKLRPVSQPSVSVTKFVPYTVLEIKVEVEVVGEITLPDYKKIKKAKPAVKVDAKDVTAVLDDLTARAAERKEVDRASKEGDQVTFDFKGVDAKTKDPIAGAEGKEYPLVIGSDTFIPGFEPELVSLKAGDEKTFTVTFPEDYGVKDLQKRKVAFTVNVHKVEELVKPKLDDAFAAQVGPFKTMDELKEDIKKQLASEKQYQADRQFENELVTEIASKSKLALPQVLIEEQLDHMDREERQNVLYRGQTWSEHLEAEGVTEEEHRKKNIPQAEERVKAGLILAEIAEHENIKVSQSELAAHVAALKARYQSDPKMQTELDKPENQRELRNRMVTEKTVQALVGYAAK